MSYGYVVDMRETSKIAHASGSDQIPSRAHLARAAAVMTCTTRPTSVSMSPHSVLGSVLAFRFTLVDTSDVPFSVTGLRSS